MNAFVSTPGSSIRVVIADDSAVMRAAIQRMLESDPGIKVIASARNGKAALQDIATLDPDVVMLDCEMPVMDGLEALQHIMHDSPRPVIMFSSLTSEGAAVTLDALALGAFDYVPKPAHANVIEVRKELVDKVKAASVSRERTRRRAQLAAVAGNGHVAPEHTAPPRSQWDTCHVSVVCLGCSTGGPAALQRILPQLPADLPVPILIVQHMPPGFTEPFARRLNGLCRIGVQEAGNGNVLEPRHVYIAPAGWHVTLRRHGTTTLLTALSSEPADSLHRPSVDIMMLSASEVCGRNAMGVIMTGMGSDGARGMQALYASGAFTLGQDESSCAVYGMPRSCAEQGSLRRVTTLDAIPGEIVKVVTGRKA